ncbi:MAG: DUF4093 domain-containing protein [Oscillospiraceae bacterium]
MIKIDKAIIVEGKYDKIRLSNIFDAPIIVTNGFSIFKDKENLELIRQLADKMGIVVLTDSDSAGQMIRSYMKKCIDSSKIFNVYIPEIFGKEKRKTSPSAAGTLGVEGVSDEIIKEAFNRAGLLCQKVESETKKITSADLFSLKLSGGVNSSEKRKALMKKMKLPTIMSTPAMLTAVNALYTYDEFISILEEME